MPSVDDASVPAPPASQFLGLPPPPPPLPPPPPGGGLEPPQPPTASANAKTSFVKRMGAPLPLLRYDTTRMNRRTFLRRGLFGGLLLAVGGSVGLVAWPSDEKARARQSLRAL